MKFNITYYAMFREEAGCSGEVIESDADNAASVFELLQEKHGFSMKQSHVRLAVNDTFVSWDTPLNEGDHLVFIPPVAGG